MTCREFADFMADYLSNDLAAEVRAAFERHLQICENCEKYLQHYGATVALGKRAFQDDQAALPPDVPDALVNAILSSRPKR